MVVQVFVVCYGFQSLETYIRAGTMIAIIKQTADERNKKQDR